MHDVVMIHIQQRLINGELPVLAGCGQDEDGGFPRPVFQKTAYETIAEPTRAKSSVPQHAQRAH